ncbi:fimbrial protein, partial [Klebsiella pneumoniae]
LWANSGTAQNVGILFQDGNGNNLKTGDVIFQNLNAGSNTINLSARMQALGVATGGSVKSTVAYVLDYQ